ncbi:MULTISPECIES: hypothetical protein [Celeribacter]|uniref:hypothetical protein n=1 Tax=Celeribacter TaxID=875170 RepID=UPI003A95C988
MRVAVAGHRWNRIDPETEAKHLAALLRSAMEALPGSDGTVTLVTGMAEGTDLTAAAVRPAHWCLEAALALSESCWRDHLGTAKGVREEDFRAYESLIECASVVVPGNDRGTPDYVALAAYLTTTCHHLLTVWNGVDGPAGGTSDVVALAKDRGVPVVNIWKPLAALRSQAGGCSDINRGDVPD